MRVTLHDYQTDPHLPQKDGVNLAHENIAAIMRSLPDEDVDVIFHDLWRLLSDDDYARWVLFRVDCVVSNVGPHAHYYFYLREKFSLEFTIVRDVRTAVWSSYLLQEYLCQPYLRHGDLLMVASHYTRGVYEKIFSHLRASRTLCCYPLSIAFPALPPPRKVPARPDGVLTLGYIGRLSEDKNFPDVVELLIRLNRQAPGRYRLLACGDIHSTSCCPEAIDERLQRELGPGDYFEYLPARANSRVWELYGRFDVKLFPSTSNLETLGRVLIEASYAGVPVVCGEHAAAPELIPASSLCQVHYCRNELFSGHFDHSLGNVDLDDMERVITERRFQAAACYGEYRHHPEKFIRALRDQYQRQDSFGEALRLRPAQRRFIESLEVELPSPLSPSGADSLIGELARWFVALQDSGHRDRDRLLARLLELSRYPERTRSYLEKTRRTRGDFTNVGGLDIELCQVADFYPSFLIRDEEAAQAIEERASSFG